MGLLCGGQLSMDDKTMRRVDDVLNGKGKRIRHILNLVLRYTILVLIALFFMFPVIYMIIVSFMSNTAALAPQTIFPRAQDFAVVGYKDFFSRASFFKGIGNTLIVCVLCIGGILTGATFCAYGLTKVYFKGQKAMFIIILATVFLPGTVTSIPLYTIYQKIGWCNTLFPLWVPIWFGGGAMNIFLVRQFMRGIPKSLHESAKIDGANSFQILITIIVPLIRPILLYLAITTFIGTWNDYSAPLLYLTTETSPKTLALLIFEAFQDQRDPLILNGQMATGIMMMIPTTILFGFFQKELTEGISLIGLKV